MLMVIFGAGASYDSIDPQNLLPDSNFNARPPLARELFDVRPNFGNAVNRFYEIRGVIGDLRTAVRSGQDIERQLEDLRGGAATYSRNHRYLSAVQFYLQLILSNCGSQWSDSANGVTNYFTLLDLLERWRRRRAGELTVPLITFNYDTLLDAACADFDYRPAASIDDYISTYRTFPLFKLHGSVDWGMRTQLRVQLASLDGPRHEMIAQAPVTPSEEWEIHQSPADNATYQKVTEAGTEVYGIYPAIAVPVMAKDSSDFACPRGHIEALKRLIPRVTQLLIIGWRGHEEHFLSLWEAHQVQRVIAVAEDVASADATIVALQASGMVAASTSRVPLGEGFTGFVRRREEVITLLDG